MPSSGRATRDGWPGVPTDGPGCGRPAVLSALICARLVSTGGLQSSKCHQGSRGVGSVKGDRVKETNKQLS